MNGPGSRVGEALIRRPEIRVISFTGSLDVANRIFKVAGFKRIIIEAGSNSACVVMDDADIPFAAKRIVTGAFTLAGQVCISVQRVYIHEKIFDKFMNEILNLTKNLKVGNPMEEDTDVGPMISEDAAKRAEKWIEEAVNMGAKILCGGKRKGTFLEPTILLNVPHSSHIYKDEAFCPVICVEKIKNIDEAIKLVNDSKYGLQAGIFTKDLKTALKFAKEVEVGGVNIGDVPTFRADPQPYGGVKGSGLGREGPAFAIEELTEIKSVCFNL